MSDADANTVAYGAQLTELLRAGVCGLTSALLLSRRRENTVTVVAKHMPGDYDIEYTSPWAGANVLPSVFHPNISDEGDSESSRMADEAHNRWERETWPELRRLAAEVPEAGIHFQSMY